MEITLNLVWTMIAVACVCLWFRFEARTGAERRLSAIALVLLIIVLFPVISVSDDLWAMQNPAETDSCQRRDHDISCHHCIIPFVAFLTASLFDEPQSALEPPRTPIASQRISVQDPAVSQIQNRPPPLV